MAAGDIMPSELPVPQHLSTDFDGLRAEFDFAADDAVVAKCLV
ncbi:TetR family transcriptional regulator, partial [Mycobacterium sp. ITM-2017-0098]